MEFSRKMILLPSDYENSIKTNQSEIINRIYENFPKELIQLIIKSKVDPNLFDNLEIKSHIENYKTPEIQASRINIVTNNKSKKYNKSKTKKIHKRKINWEIASDSE